MNRAAKNIRVAERGFTLIEVMVAVVVLSLAIGASVSLLGENTRALARLDDRAYAEIVADNLLVETMAAVRAPALGEETGEIALAGREWVWTRRVRATAFPTIREVRVDVRRADGEGVLFALTALREVRR